MKTKEDFFHFVRGGARRVRTSRWPGWIHSRRVSLSFLPSKEHFGNFLGKLKARYTVGNVEKWKRINNISSLISWIWCLYFPSFQSQIKKGVFSAFDVVSSNIFSYIFLFQQSNISCIWCVCVSEGDSWGDEERGGWVKRRHGEAFVWDLERIWHRCNVTQPKTKKKIHQNFDVAYESNIKPQKPFEKRKTLFKNHRKNGDAEPSTKLLKQIAKKLNKKWWNSVSLQR